MGRGRPPKCKICGTQLKVETAYLVIARNRNGVEKKAFYCSQEEFESHNANIRAATAVKAETKIEKKSKKQSIKLQEDKKDPTDRDMAYRLICEILGRKEIVNTALWKEWKEWNNVSNDTLIRQYLSENKEWMTRKIAGLNSTEFGCIRYLSAILKNNLSDYQPKQIPERVVVESTVEFVLFEPQMVAHDLHNDCILEDVEDDWI